MKNKHVLTSLGLAIVITLSGTNVYAASKKNVQPSLNAAKTQEQSKANGRVQEQANQKSEKAKEASKTAAEKKAEAAQKRKGAEAAYSIKLEKGNLLLQLEEEKELEEELGISLSVSEAVYGGASSQKGLQMQVQKLKNASDEKSITKLAIVYKNLGDLESALKTAQKLLEQNPYHKKALLLTAQIYRDQKSYVEAQKLVDKLQTAYPDLNLTAFQAILKEEAGDIKGAIEDLKESVKLAPKEKDLYKKLGTLMQQLGDHGLKLFIDGDIPTMDVKPIIQSGSTLVPSRAVSESLGAEVTYDTATKTVLIKKGDTTIKLPLGINKAYVNDKEVTIEAPSLLLNGRLLVPIRFITETLGGNVTYDPETKVAIIVSEELSNEASSSDAN